MAAKGNKAAQELWAKREEIVNKHWDEFKSDADMSEAQISAEIIAEAYEKWLYSGQKAEDAATQKLFTAIRDFFRDIYRSIKAIGGVEVTEEVDAFFREISGLDTDNEVQTLAQAAGNKQAVDLTAEFGNIKGLTKENARELINTKLNELINKPLKTGTPPLRIQVTAGNKAHIKKPNVPLKGSGKARHQAVLSVLEKIVSNAEKTDRPGEVDLTHNTRRKTLKHKAKVKEYVYFEAPIQINVTDKNGNIETAVFTVELATERVKGQNKNLLNLYNVRTKKRSPHTPLSVSAGNNNNITEKEGVVNSKNTLHQKGVNVNFDEIKESQEYKKLKEQIDSDRKIITENADKIAKNIDTYLKDPTDDEARRKIYYQRGISDKTKQKAREVKAALQKIAEGAEEATLANLRNDLEQYGGTNDVTFKFGDEKKGIRHIAEKHGFKTLLQVFDSVVDGEVIKFVKGKKTVHILKNGIEAVLSLDEHGNKKTWLLTGWDNKISPEEERQFRTNLNSAQNTPTFSRRDLVAGLNNSITDTEENLKWETFYQRGYHGTPYEFDELATEQVKGQDKNLLDLYNVHIKRNPAGMHLSTFPQGFSKDSITDKNGKIKAYFINFEGELKHTTNSEGKAIGKSFAEIYNFYRWFGDSKAVDEQGRPLVVYHGTSKDFEIFKNTNKRFRNKYDNYEVKDVRGFYFTPDIKSAEVYSQADEGTPNIKEVYLSLKKPKVYNNYEDIAFITSEKVSELKKAGYDGAVYKDRGEFGETDSSMTEYVVFEANQIKSTDNRGTFDPNEDNIYYQRKKKVQADKEQKVRDRKAAESGAVCETAKK